MDINIKPTCEEKLLKSLNVMKSHHNSRLNTEIMLCKNLLKQIKGKIRNWLRRKRKIDLQYIKNENFNSKFDQQYFQSGFLIFLSD